MYGNHSPKGYVRYAEENQAADAIKGAKEAAEDGVVKINDAEVTLTLLEGVCCVKVGVEVGWGGG